MATLGQRIQVLQNQHQIVDRSSSTASNADETALLLQPPNPLHPHNDQLRRIGERPQQETFIGRLPPQPLALYGTFAVDNKHEQRGDTTGSSSHACSVGGAAPDHRRFSATRAAAADRRDDSGLTGPYDGAPPSLTRQAQGDPKRTGSKFPAPHRPYVRRGRSEECASGAAFVRSRQGPGSGRPKGEEVRESSPPAQQVFFALDGAQDEVEGRQGRTKDRERGLMSVRERIAALEARTTNRDKPVALSNTQATKPRAAPKPSPKNVAIVYPLHYKRFVRRTSSAASSRPGTPLYKSNPLDEGTVIHSPMPMRSFSSIKTPPIDVHALTTAPIQKFQPTASETSQQKRKKYVGYQPSITNDGGDHITPAAFLQGTRDNCHRHGRKTSLPIRKPGFGGTRDMLAKSTSGVYIPTGMAKRRQMEATSPWAASAPKKALTNSTGTDACPDCIAELNIKRREFNQMSIESVQRPVEDAAAGISAGSPPSLKTVKPLKTSSSEYSQEASQRNRVVSSDMGGRFDAIIIHRAGEVQHVVLNSDIDKPASETMQRLSKELLKVADSISSSNRGEQTLLPAKTSQKKNTRASVIVSQTGAKEADSRLSSVPELLDMIDQAASEIHLNTRKPSDQFESAPTLVRTRPSLRPASQPLKSSNVTAKPLQTPSPKQQSSVVHHAIELFPSPTSTAPAFPSPKIQAMATPQHDYNPFHSFLNPFCHRSPHNPTGTTRTPTSSPAPHEIATSYSASSPSSGKGHPQLQTLLLANPTSPLSGASTALLHPAGVKDITTRPKPYHHAPSTPPNLNVAQYVDKQVQEHQRIIRQAMNMQKDRVVSSACSVTVVAASSSGAAVSAVSQETGRAEREGRRLRSAMGGHPGAVKKRASAGDVLPGGVG